MFWLSSGCSIFIIQDCFSWPLIPRWASEAMIVKTLLSARRLESRISKSSDRVCLFLFYLTHENRLRKPNRQTHHNHRSVIKLKSADEFGQRWLVLNAFSCENKLVPSVPWGSYRHVEGIKHKESTQIQFYSCSPEQYASVEWSACVCVCVVGCVWFLSERAAAVFSRLLVEPLKSPIAHCDTR